MANIYRDTAGANGSVARKYALTLVVSVLLTLLAVRMANAQNLPSGADYHFFTGCVNQLQNMNPWQGDMTRIQVDDILLLPPCAIPTSDGIGENSPSGYFVHAGNAEMVRKYGGWGIVFERTFGRFPTQEEFANRELPVEGEPLPATTSEQTASVLPTWAWWSFALGLLLGIGIGIYFARILREEKRRKTPVEVGSSTDEPGLRHGAFSAMPVRDATTAGDLFQRHTAPRIGPDWVVVYDSVRQVFLNGGPVPVVFTSRYLGGDMSHTEPRSFRDTPAWRGTLRNIRTGRTHEALALAQCFNEVVGLTGVTVTYLPVHPQVTEPDPLIGTTATITAVERGDNGAIAMTLEHPTVGTLTGTPAGNRDATERQTLVFGAPRAE